MKFFKKPGLFAVCYSVLLVAFTAYVLLDAFVIPRSYQAVQTPAVTATPLPSPDPVVSNVARPDESPEISPFEEPPLAVTEPIITESSYTDENISVTLTLYRENDTDVYVADVTLTSAEYLKRVFANYTYGKNITAKTSSIAEEAGAILAINGDYYGAQNRGYVIADGVVYRERSADAAQQDLAIYQDGSFQLISEGDITAAQLVENGVTDLLCFGPGLVENGEIAVSEYDEVDKAMTSNPRTAIGIIDDLHYIFVVSDGRTDQSEGLTLFQLAQFMTGLDVQTAYNLDGGGSTTMYFLGQVVNSPTSGRRSSGERSVSDIVCIAY